MSLVVRPAGPADLPAAYALRHRVFTLEQGVPAAVERDDRDAAAVHVVAVRDGTIVGAGRLVRSGQAGVVGRMAVLPAARGGGVGSAILRELERVAADTGLSTVELHAQLQAHDFYRRAGYAPMGDRYLEAGIEHVTMRKPLPVVRPVRDADSAPLIALIAGCWAEYPGCVMDVDGEEPWLRAPASAYRRWGGSMWVISLDGDLVGSVGLKPAGEATVELKSLYVAAGARRRGLGRRLAAIVEDAARRRGATTVHLWSDSRFAQAHLLYHLLGYDRLAETRELNDRSKTTEYAYAKKL